MSTPKGLRYRVDARDTLDFVSPEWDLFAAANDGEAALSFRVLGTTLWDHVSDGTSRELYRLVLARARKGTRILFDLRCDAPDVRRRLAMEVTPGPDGAVEFRTRILTEEPRFAAPVLHSAGGDEPAALLACSWCNRFLVDSSWEEIEVAAASLKLFDRTPPPLVSHGICEPCSQEMLRSMSAGGR